MNRMAFALRNVLDKLRKSLRQPDLLLFYFRTYLLARYKAPKPDVFIVSYPKCGRTWLRMLLLEMARQNGWKQVRCPSAAVLAYEGRPVVQFTHHQGNWVPVPLHKRSMRIKPASFRGRKVVFLYRDPRDVLVSSWYHLTYREKNLRMPLAEFIRNPYLGIDKITGFYNLWLRDQPRDYGFHTLSYEDLHERSTQVVADLLCFAGWAVAPETVESALRESTFEKMKAKEKQGTLSEAWMRSGDHADDRSMKIRKGKIGGFREELSAEDVEFLNQRMRDALIVPLPYEP